MATGFTESERLSICDICGIDTISLTQVLSHYDNEITSEVEAKVRTLIDRWDSGVGTNFVRVVPDSSNKGVDIDPEREKNDIRRSISNLLYIKNHPASQVRMRRG